MTASERARDLVKTYQLKINLAVPYSFANGYAERDDAEAALLAYVARLEACVAAARSLETCLMTDEIDCSVDERIARLFRALAALDRLEDGETT